ncbi:MAG: cellulase family glycosylhydrolase, partial [Chloroflexi bacterium]|nr:cellulase family glycosylhydrolase [Chloroflexota bacterium]
IKVRKLAFSEGLNAWTMGTEQAVLLDWSGRGASFPVLAFTGTRLWLAYRYYDGNGYSISVQYADPDASFDYPDSSWSSPFQVSRTTGDQGIYALLVPHDARLSIFSSQNNIGAGGGQSGIIWRMLDDPQRRPNEWREAFALFRTEIRGQETTFSAIADDLGNIHLVTGKQGLFSAYLRYDGSDWSRPTQLAVNGVFSVSLARDGEETWALWNKVEPNGSNRIIARRWQPDIGWARTAESPWRERFGVELPSVLWYRSASGGYSDITRYATISGGAGPATVVSKFLKRGEDAIYVRDDGKFNYVPFKLVSLGSVVPDISFEYWDGSQWSPLTMAPELVNGIGSPRVSDVGFVPPQDWQPTQVNGTSGFFVRLKRDGLRPTVSNLLRIDSSQRVFGPLANSSIAGVVDVLWSESNQDSDRGRLWYGAVSPDGTYPSAGTPEHEHKVEPAVLRGLSTASVRPAPLPSGSPRQYTQVSLDTEETHEYQLLDGQVRYVKILETELVEQSPEGVTIWATATVEVSGPGIEPERAVIPAAYFQAPVILNSVRIYVEITREFNDFQLTEGGATTGSARLMLSDARFSLTDLTQYSYPFPGTVWGLGALNSYYQGLSGTGGKLRHRAYFRQAMPSGLDFRAWRQGVLQLGLKEGWEFSITDARDGLSNDWHFAAPFEPSDTDRIGTRIEMGEKVGTVGGPNDVVIIKWGREASYDWAPLLAEWYVANASPIERSYVKDWLVLGPIDSPTRSRSLPQSDDGEGFVSPLEMEFLPQEAAVTPIAGDQVGDSLAWRRYDGIVPGVIDVTEALSDFPNSGWARIDGKNANSVAYFATYLYSRFFQNIVLNVGSSDAIKVWLGEEVVLDKDTFIRVKRKSDWSILPDQYQAAVELQPGWNRVLIKLSQGKADFRGIQAPQNGWQLSFRVSDSGGRPVNSVVVSPEKDLSADPMARFAIPEGRPRFAERARPPERVQEWPEVANLEIGESVNYTLRDGSLRTVTLLSYDVVIPRHKVQATVSVSSEEKVEIHTVEVALAAVPVSINGVRIYAYAWKDARQYGFESGDSAFPLAIGKDIALALSDAQYTMFPDIDSYVYPFDSAFHENGNMQTFLEPAGRGSFKQLVGHSGFDIHAPPDSSLVAMHDGTVWYKPGQVILSTTTGEKSDPVRWFWSHVPDSFGSATVPSGTFVKKGTPLALGGSHMEAPGGFDFGSFIFTTEIWNNQHKTDYPTPRYWLVLGPYDGSIDTNNMTANESRDLPSTLLPMEGSPDYRNDRSWKFGDNMVNSIVNIGELLSESPFSGLEDREHLNAVAYAATYVYSPEDHTTDGQIWLKWGASFGSKVWLNGKTVIDNTDSLQGHRFYTYTDERPLIIDEFAAGLPLKKGWNTLIVKVNQGSRASKAWRFSAKIGDLEGNSIPGLRFSTRNINLRVDSTEDESVSISWDRPVYHGTNVTGYRVDVARDAAFTDLLADDLNVGDVTTFKFQGLASGKTYFIRVKPYNDWELGGSVYWQHFDAVEVEGRSNLPNGFEVVPPNVSDDIVPDASSTVVPDASSAVVPVAANAVVPEAANAPVADDNDAVPEETSDTAPAAESVDPLALTFRLADPSIDGWLSVNGNRIVGEDGTPVILRGVNLENREWEWASLRTLKFERTAIPVVAGEPPFGWGANLISIAIASGPVNREVRTYMNFLDELVSISRENGAYILITYRYPEPNDDQPNQPDNDAERAMAFLAERYERDPNVLYGLQVDPHDVSWKDLKPRFTVMVDAIRRNNDKALIAIPGTNWGRDISHAINNPIKRDNLIYKTHTSDDWKTIQRDYDLEAVAKRVPVLIGEFGAGPSMDFDDLESLLDFAEERGISWAGWLFHDKGCPCMLEDSEDFSVTEYGRIVKERLQLAAMAN